jgi:acyl-ACP thioesterase
MYKEKVQITSIDVDHNLELKLSSLFKYMQAVASNHAESVKVGHWELFEHNLLWVVIRMEVKIYQTPKLDEVITIGTHPGETRSFMYPRYFEIYDSKGKLIIAASSIWAMIDKDTRRVVAKPEGIRPVKAEVDKNDLPLPLRVVGDANSKVDSRKVRYTEIDLNGHLNNTSYIEYLLDTHEPSFYTAHRISGININYDKEIKNGDEVTLYSNGQTPEIIKGFVGESNHFTAKIEYEER